MAIPYATAWRGARHTPINLTSVPWEGTYMRNRIFRLAVLAAASLVIPAAASSAQEMTLPPPRPSPQHAFDRALATLTPAQRGPAVRALASTEESAR